MSGFMYNGYKFPSSRWLNNLYAVIVFFGSGFVRNEYRMLISKFSLSVLTSAFCSVLASIPLTFAVIAFCKASTAFFTALASASSPCLRKRLNIFLNQIKSLCPMDKSLVTMSRKSEVLSIRCLEILSPTSILISRSDIPFVLGSVLYLLRQYSSSCLYLSDISISLSTCFR